MSALAARVVAALLVAAPPTAVPLLAAACASAPVDDHAERAVREVTLPDGRLQLTLEVEDQDVVRRALLEEVPVPAPAAGAPRVLRVERHEPAGSSLAWLYGLVPPSFDIELEAGRAEPHPDRHAGAELMRLLDSRPPALESALAGLERLYRLEPRATVLEKAARLALTPEQLDRITSVAVADRTGPLFTPGPGGALVGGSRADALRAVLGALAARPDLGAERADRLVAALPSLQRDAFEHELLLALGRRGASARALVRAHEALAEAEGPRARLRRDVLLAIAKREGGLAGADADLVAEACPDVGNDGYEAEVLLALVPAGASAAAVIEAAEAIEQPERAKDRAGLLLALGARAPLDPADADRIARAAPALGDATLAAPVLERLIAKGAGSTSALMRAIGELADAPGGGAASTRKLATALVERRGQVAEDADAMAEETGLLVDDEVEAEILLALVGRGQVSAAAALEGYRDLGGAARRRQVLLALVALRGAEAGPAEAIAGAVAGLGDPAVEAEVLLALLARGAAPTDALIDAATAIAGGGATAAAARQRVLLAICDRRGASADDADALAGASGEIDDDALEAALLLALVRKGAVDTDAAIDAAQEIDGVGAARHRADVVLGLAKARGARRDDAEAIARAAGGIDDDQLESEALVAIARAGEASVESVLDAASSLDVERSTPQHLFAVLEALARRARLEQADADLCCRAAARLESDALEADLLVLLARKASPAAIDDALREVASPAESGRVEAALGGR